MRRLVPGTHCPDCATPIAAQARIKLEFLGGEILCPNCGAVLHIDHRWWWFGVSMLGCEGTLLVALGLVLLTTVIRWWIVAALAVAFVAAGVLVALSSPLKVVERRSDGQER